MYLRRGDVWRHLSEHLGDARPDTLVYLYVDDVDAIADEFGATVHTQPWAGEIELADLDGNRLRIGTRPPGSSSSGWARVVSSEICPTASPSTPPMIREE